MTATPESLVQPVRTTPLPLPDDFEVYNGSLFYRGIDLLSLIQRPIYHQGRIEMPTTPLSIRFLPRLRDNYQQLLSWFETAKANTNFAGHLSVAYASKANPAEPVVRTLLQAGTAYECSSSFDVEIVHHAAAHGWLDTNRTILANGVKTPAYAEALIRLRADGFTHVTPIFDDLDEIAPFAESGLTFDVGVRSRTEASYQNRFGMNPDDLEDAARQINALGNLRLTTFHAMQTISASRGLPYQVSITHSLRTYARLSRIAPTLHIFDTGGGVPGRDSDMDFQDWMNQLLQNIMAVCDDEEVPTPDLLIESGSYLVEDHACKLFNIIKTKMADDGLPFYLINGSIMSSLPDAWALGEAYTTLPINHWDAPFQPVRLAGLTCDSDDIYPTKRMSQDHVDLPVDSDGLIVGFFDCGAYEDILGGQHGTKHCLLPESAELILDEESEGLLVHSYHPGQTAAQALFNIGYMG